MLASASQEEKKRKREKEHCDTEGEADDFDPGKKVEVEPPPDRPVRACRTQPGKCWHLQRLSWSVGACHCEVEVCAVSLWGEAYGGGEGWREGGSFLARASQDMQLELRFFRHL